MNEIISFRKWTLLSESFTNDLIEYYPTEQ